MWTSHVEVEAARSRHSPQVDDVDHGVIDRTEVVGRRHSAGDETKINVPSHEGLRDRMADGDGDSTEVDDVDDRVAGNMTEIIGDGRR